MNKKIGILGLGEENRALVDWLLEHGAHNITVCDQKSREELGPVYQELEYKVAWRLGADYLDNLRDFDVLFRTPGLPYLNPQIQAAKEAGVDISSEIKLFFDLCPSPIVGVTGTKGKGTTATLISEILKSKFEARSSKHETISNGQNPKVSNIRDSNLNIVSDFDIRISDLKPKVFLAGNIGQPPIEFLDKLTANDIVILELSSFQLQDLEKSPHLAVVLDIKTDHLDVHQTREEYLGAKKNIVKYQTEKDFAVVNADYLDSLSLAELSKAKVFFFSRQKEMDQGAFVRGDDIIVKINDKEDIIANKDEVLLRGEHNVENICAAALTTTLLGADIEAIKATIKNFKGLEHRLEYVGKIRGLEFYNDSFSTTPDTTIAAIKSFQEPLILLLGGSEKKADYSELGQAIKDSSVKAIISIGGTATRIIEAIGKTDIKIMREVQSMTQAVALALEMGKSGDVVVLSPASASFDCYDNYKDRGNQFKKAVLEYA